MTSLPPPPPLDAGGAAPVSTKGAPGKAAVFGQVLWRSIVLAMIGGAVIGAIVLVPFAIIEDDTEVSDIGLAAYIGAFIGVLLGLLAGLVVGAVASIKLVPYPGRQRALYVVRSVSILVVALFFLLLFWNILGSAVAWAIIAGALAGTALLSPWLITWYVKRMNDD